MLSAKKIIGFGAPLLIITLAAILVFKAGCGSKSLISVNLPKAPVLKDTSYVYEIDTTVVVIHDTVWQTQIVKIPTIVYRNADVVDLTEPQTYRDSVEDETVKLYFEAYTAGVLDSITLSYKLKKPVSIKETAERIINSKTTVTVVETSYPAGLFAGLDFHKYPGSWDVAPSTELTLQSGWSFGYAYGLRNNSHTISIKRRINSKK